VLTEAEAISTQTATFSPKLSEIASNVDGLTVQLATMTQYIDSMELILSTLVDRLALGAIILFYGLGVVMAYVGIRFLWNISFRNFQP
jgi:hypothetical protein